MKSDQPYKTKPIAPRRNAVIKTPQTVQVKHPTASPDEIDEQSISGSAPDPDSDDDTLQNAQMMGQQLEEDTENPEELDLARDINKAEKFVHE